MPNIRKMEKLSAYLQKLNNYCNCYLEFDSTNNRYKFNQKFSDEVNCELFESKVDDLKDELFNILDTIEKPRTYIAKVIAILNEAISWYESEKIYDFSSFKKFTLLITTSKDNKQSDSNQITLKEILESPEVLSPDLDDIFYYLILFKSKTDNYNNENDFEKVKLHYVLTKYFESIYSFIKSLIILEYIDDNFGLKEYDRFRPIKNPEPRCVGNLKKDELVTFFHGLFQSGLLGFNFNSKVRREKAIFNFLDKNFNYVDRRNRIVKVSNSAKVYGQIYKGHNKDRQIEIIDSLIDQLNVIKGNLK